MRALIYAALAATLPSLLQAQTIAGVEVPLGATRAEVEATLGNHVELLANGAVMSRDGPPFQLYGGVSFDEDRVIEVRRRWFLGGGTPKDFAAAAVAMLTQVDYPDGCAVVDASDPPSPGRSNRSVFITCDVGHYFEIEVSEQTGMNVAPNAVEVWTTRLEPWGGARR